MGEITAAQAAAAAGTDTGLTHFETYLGGDETGDTFIFDLNGSYEISDRLSLYGGVNNLTDEIPFVNQIAWPVSPRGRFVFMGVNFRM
jgi:outer membrane receptor protein involved in Fe transport